MGYKKQPRCILGSCCLCFSVETGAKIIGYMGVTTNSIAIIFNIVMIVLLAIGPTPSPDPNITTTTEWPTSSTGAYFYDDIGNAMNLTDDVNVNSIFPDSDLHTNIIKSIILVIIGLVINIFNLSVFVIMLLGLYKRVPSYVKFGLIVGVVNWIVAFVIIIAVVIAAPSLPYLTALLYLVVPLYFLLVIRSAYYNMLESEVILPIVDQPPLQMTKSLS